MGAYQPAYDEMLRTIPNNHVCRRSSWWFRIYDKPNHLESSRHWDLMEGLSNDQRITNLFIKGCHHRSLGFIFILQNIFHRGKELRDMSLNCHYLVLFKSPRDCSKVSHLAKQMLPGHVNACKKCKKRFRMRQNTLMVTCYATSNRKRLPTSGCAHSVSRGRLSSRMSERNKNAPSYWLKSVEYGDWERYQLSLATFSVLSSSSSVPSST